MDLREQKISQFKWNYKANSRRNSILDVSISIKKDGKVTFVFRNGVHEIISGTQYFVCAICKNRMFFMEADSADGYKLTVSDTKGCNRYAQMSIDDGISFIGDYELKYDDFLELYYIEK